MWFNILKYYKINPELREWDWEEELFNFISDPDAALKDAEEKFS